MISEFLSKEMLEKIKSLPSVKDVIMETVSMEQLTTYYKPVEVEGYCSSCPNYGHIWSCPPFDFDVKSIFSPYKEAVIIGVKTTDFESTRRSFGDLLIEFSKRNPVEVLIAGNCALCESCAKQTGMPCIKENDMKYSLESIGFHVGDICDQILKSPLEWKGDNLTTMAVGAILCN